MNREHVASALRADTISCRGLDGFQKELLDRCVAVVLVVLLLPIFCLIAVAVKLDSRGPVFHRRRVLGLGGRQFSALKFRSMLPDADRVLNGNEALRAEFAATSKIRQDPRITRVGRVLRHYSLDELPQLFNVAAGQMSLVGPRMITDGELEKYSIWSSTLLTVKPGMTGLWQVSGRSDVGWGERVALDIRYVQNRNLWMDLAILLKTIPVAVLGKGAY